MWFSKFSTKKVILSKKSIFRLIMTSNIFHLKIIFYIGKMVSKKFWRSKKSFLSNNRAWSTLPPLPQCCWENVKKCQNFTYGYFDKNSKNTIINRETVFTKIFEKTRTYGDFDENFQKFAGHLRVKDTPPFKTRILKKYILCHLIKWISLSFGRNLTNIFMIFPNYILIFFDSTTCALYL